MGLDTVEFVMAVEKEFKIHIDDKTAAKILTAGELRDHVLTLLPPTEQHPSRVWRRIKHILMKDYRIPSAEIKPNSRFVKDLGLD